MKRLNSGQTAAPSRVLLQLTLRGEPCPKGRPRFGRGRTYTPTATRHAEAVIAWEAGRVLRTVHDDAHSRFVLKLRFYCAALWGPDTDNLAKLVMDALSPRRYKRRASGPGLLWRNDRQVVWVDAFRVDHCKDPRTEILVMHWRDLSCHG